MNTIGRLTGCLLTTVLLGASVVWAAEAPLPRNSPKVLQAFRSVVARPSQSTVRVLCQGKETALGTVVRADGYILTKASELKGTPVCKFKNGKELPARVVGIEPKNDLALLKVEATGLTPIEWRHSKQAAVGNWIASPGITEDPVAIGVVSVATRNPSKMELAMMGGAPIPPNAGYLGVGLEPADEGPKISQVVPGGPAARAGFQAGDIVLAVAGTKVPDPEKLVKAIQNFKPGDQVVLKVKRGDEELELKAKLEKRPANGMDRADFQNRMGSTLSNRRGGFQTILQHDTIIKPTDCGGPLVDLDGKAVGINIARAGRTESYALPSELVQSQLPDLLSGKLAPKEEVADTEKPAPRKAPKTKLEAAEFAVRDAEEALAEARRQGDRKVIRAAREKLAEAEAAFEKMKAETKK
jgi:serine protease Do